jgi:hypothetical protein
MLASLRLRTHRYRDAAEAAEHALEFDGSGPQAPGIARILYQCRARLGNHVPIWRGLHRPVRVVIGTAAFASVAVMSSLRVALLAALVPVAAHYSYMFVAMRRLPEPARFHLVRETTLARAQSLDGAGRSWRRTLLSRRGLSVGTLATFAVVEGAAVGATFGAAWIGALAVVGGAALVALALWAWFVWRQYRWDGAIAAASAAHDEHDFEAQWNRVRHLHGVELRDAPAHRAYVHALTHHDVDAAMIPLDALLNEPPDTTSARGALHCAAQAVSWALLVRGHVGGALEWAKRAVEIAPDRPRSQYACALAEAGDIAGARAALAEGCAVDDMSPATIAGDLRARAIAAALLGRDLAAYTSIEEARALDATSEEFVFAVRRVGEIIDLRNDEAV